MFVLVPTIKKKTGVTAINDLVATLFDKTALKFGAGKTFTNDFRFEGDSFGHANPFVIRGQTGLSLFVNH